MRTKATVVEGINSSCYQENKQVKIELQKSVAGFCPIYHCRLIKSNAFIKRFLSASSRVASNEVESSNVTYFIISNSIALVFFQQRRRIFGQWCAGIGCHSCKPKGNALYFQGGFTVFFFIHLGWSIVHINTVSTL